MTINVVTKRGTNEYHGAARFSYASANWQSDNTPQEAIDQGIPTDSTRMLREYGADFGGPIIRDKLWLWFAGAYQTISKNVTGRPRRARLPVVGQPRALEREAELADLQRERGAALLPEKRPDAVQHERRTDARSRGGDAAVDPDQLLQDRGLPRLLGGSLRLDLRGLSEPDYTDLGNGSLDCDNVPFEIACNGDQSRDAYWIDPQYHNNYRYYWAKDPQKQANGQVSKFFNTGSLNHELKFSFNYRQQIADSATGWPGTQNLGIEYAYSSSNTALLARGVRPIFKNQIWSGTLGDTLTAAISRSSWESVTTGSRPRTFRAGRSRTWCSRSCCRRSNTTEPTTGSSTSRTGSRASRRRTRSARRRTRCSGPPTRSSPTSSGSSATTGAASRYPTATTTTGPTSTATTSCKPNEIDLENGFYGFYNDIDPATLPNVPNIIDPTLKTPKTNELTFGIDHQFTDDFAVSATFNYRTTNSLLENIPNGSNGGTWELAGGRSALDPDDETQALVPCTATAANGFTLTFDEPFYSLTLPDEPVGVTINNRPGGDPEVLRRRLLGVVKRLSDSWMFRGNFGWNNFKQHLKAASIEDPNNLWGGTNCGADPAGAPASRPASPPRIPSGSTRTGSSTSTRCTRAPGGSTSARTSSAGRAIPNPYYVRTRAVDAAGVNHRYPIQIDQVDDFRYDNVYQLDLRLAKTFQLGQVAVTPAAELFNVANAGTVLQRGQRVGDYRASTGSLHRRTTTFNQIFEVQSPRIVRLGHQRQLLGRFSLFPGPVREFRAGPFAFGAG